MQGITAVCVRLSGAAPAGGAVVGRDRATLGVRGVDGLIEELAGGGVVFRGGAFDSLTEAKATTHPRGQCGAAGPRPRGDAAGSGCGRRRGGEEEGLDEDDVWWEEEAADDDEEEKERGEGGAPPKAGHIYRPEEDEAVFTQG